MTKAALNKHYDFDWADLAFGSKKPVNSLNATFIAAPRHLSTKRFSELVKKYLPKGNIILGLAKEAYVQGFEDQPQFKTLTQDDVQNIISKVRATKSPNKIYTLGYFQREVNYILQKLDFRHVVFVNGSWQYTFHTRAEYYVIANKRLACDLVSPFIDEAEARTYENATAETIKKSFPLPRAGEKLDEVKMMLAAGRAAKYSYDYNFQTALALGKETGRGKYQFITALHNKVVPYETYAMLHGASRETNFSPPHDLNHYDTVHAEVRLIIKAAEQGIDLNDTTLFINLLPCPPCSRMLCETAIKELVYVQDHSDGYAVRVLELAGKKVRRLVPNES